MLSVAHALGCWQYFVLLLSSSQVFSAFAEQFFSDASESMLNLTKSTCVTTRAKSSLHFFIDGVESAWPACYFFSSGIHRLPVALNTSFQKNKP